MQALTRRRFLAVSAAGAAMAALPAGAAPLYRWQGVAMGAGASITLTHPDAPAIAARMVTEIDRLENVFSLYRSHSALSRLNADGHLAAPPFELLECLSLAGRVHRATGGLFDPTVQPLWRVHAESHAAGGAPTDARIAVAMNAVGWHKVAFGAGVITLPRGGALTLNGIAQGYVADRVAALLTAEGLTRVLIDTGELRALGGRPEGGGWPVRIASVGDVALEDRALATSAPLGTAFDPAGKIGHILDPATGSPEPSAWQQISVAAPSAALADALSTAACLMPDRKTIAASLAAFRGATLAALLPIV